MMYAPNELAKLQYTMAAQTTATLLTPDNLAILSAQDKSADESCDAVTMVNGAAVSNVASQSAVNVNSITVFTSDVHQYNDLQYKCMWSQCTATFQSLDDLVSHVNHLHIKVEADEMYRCHWEGCPRQGKGFNARYKILIHLRTHTNEKPHGCFCGKQFSRLENLKIHKRTHTGEKPYVCPYQGCNKAYSNSSDRFKHVLTHRTDRPYCCKMPGCGKRYTDPSSLRKHMRAHGHHIRANDVKVESAERTLNISHNPVTAPDKVNSITAHDLVTSSVTQDEQISPTKIPHLPYAVAGLPALINGAFYIPSLIPNTLLPLASVPLTDSSLKVQDFEDKKVSSVGILTRDASPGAVL